MKNLSGNMSYQLNQNRFLAHQVNYRLLCYQQSRHRARQSKQLCAKHATSAAVDYEALIKSVKPESEIKGLSEYLDKLKYDKAGLVIAVVQHVDTGEVLMTAFADRPAVSQTLQCGLAAFYSRSRQSAWIKGESSGNFILVTSVHIDCDRDCLVYLGKPIGPSCHTGARTCYYTKLDVVDDALHVTGSVEDHDTGSPTSALLTLEQTIQQRAVQAAQDEDSSGKVSWTVKLLRDPELTCKKIREEADELAQTWEQREGKERAASEMADVLYHSMVLLNKQGVAVEDVLEELRRRFGVSGIAEKASRKQS